jgi:hypothetical protein
MAADRSALNAQICTPSVVIWLEPASAQMRRLGERSP